MMLLHVNHKFECLPIMVCGVPVIEVTGTAMLVGENPYPHDYGFQVKNLYLESLTQGATTVRGLHLFPDTMPTEGLCRELWKVLAEQLAEDNSAQEDFYGYAEALRLGGPD